MFLQIVLWISLMWLASLFSPFRIHHQGELAGQETMQFVSAIDDGPPDGQEVIGCGRGRGRLFARGGCSSGGSYSSASFSSCDAGTVVDTAGVMHRTGNLEWWFVKDPVKGWSYEWLTLFDGSRQLGAWHLAEGYYLDKNMISHAAPPIELPERYRTAPAAQKQQVYFGVDRSKLSKESQYTINGRPASKAQVLDQLQGDKCKPGAKGIDCDTHKPHLTIVCADKARREQILSDLRTHPDLAPYKDLFRVQAYDPRDKVAALMLAPFKLEQDERFQQSGLVVLCQAPDADGTGSRVIPIYDWQPGKALASLRASAPDYNPNNNREIGSLEIPPAALLLGAVAAVLCVGALRHRKDQPCSSPQ